MKRLLLLLLAVISLVIAGCSSSRVDTYAGNGSSFRETYMILYFKEGRDPFLKAESRIVYGNSGKIEESIIEELIKGPETPGLLEVLPKDTKLISIKTKGRTASVNLKGKTIENSKLSRWAVNSIVNSLTELPSINEVKIYINGSQFESSFRRNRSAVRREVLNPSQVMERQMTLEKKGEWLSSYLLMSDVEGSKGRKSFDEYVKELQQVENEGLLKADFTVGEYTLDPVNNNIARVKVNFITKNFDGSTYKSPDLYFPCVKVDGYWMVDWITEQDF